MYYGIVGQRIKALQLSIKEAIAYAPIWGLDVITVVKTDNVGHASKISIKLTCLNARRLRRIVKIRMKEHFFEKWGKLQLYTHHILCP